MTRLKAEARNKNRNPRLMMSEGIQRSARRAACRQRESCAKRRLQNTNSSHRGGQVALADMLRMAIGPNPRQWRVASSAPKIKSSSRLKSEKYDIALGQSPEAIALMKTAPL